MPMSAFAQTTVCHCSSSHLWNLKRKTADLYYSQTDGKTRANRICYVLVFTQSQTEKAGITLWPSLGALSSAAPHRRAKPVCPAEMICNRDGDTPKVLPSKNMVCCYSESHATASSIESQKKGKNAPKEKKNRPFLIYSIATPLLISETFG